jgi:hypothetical protein
LLQRPELAGAEATFAVDASAYFSRPGPRLIDGVEMVANLDLAGALVMNSQPRSRRWLV